jgi:serine/threonine protein kinase
MLDSGCFRAAFNSELTAKDRRDQTRRNLIPVNIEIFNNKSAFCGHTAPDSENRAHFFYCCEFADCKSFALRCRYFQEAWRDTGTITEEFRCFVLRFLETIDLLHGQNLSILDVKFDNFGFDKEGYIVVVDFGFSISFSFKLGGDNFGCRSAPDVACLHIKKSRAYPRNCLMRQKNRSDAGTFFFSKDEFGKCRDALLRDPEHGGKLWCLGIGTRTYYDESSSGLRQSKAKVISKDKALAEDAFQAAMFMIRFFRPPKPGEDNYYNMVSEASSSLEKMKKFLTPGNSVVQQDVVFTRWATLFCRALGPTRMSLKSIINSNAMLLLVLDPELDRLAHGDGIRFDGGLVSDMNCVAKLNEKWKDWYVFPILLKYEDGDRGLGIESVKEIPAKAFIGFMVGICVEEKSDMKKRNSKYAVSIISADKTSPQCYLDAQPSEELTMKWFRTNNVFSHFINAGGSKEWNCRLERREFWRHGNMILMPMYALTKDIQPREKLCWGYDPAQQASST